MAVFLQPIYTQTVGAGGASSITFNNIPQTFTDLKLVISARSTQTGDTYKKTNYYLKFNSNAEFIYSNTHLYGTGSGTASAKDSNQDYLFMGVIDADDATASTFGSAEVYIPNYTGSNFKSVIGDSVSENNATAALQIFNAGLWRKTDAISSIFIAGIGGNFKQYSTFSLYGILRSGV